MIGLYRLRAAFMFLGLMCAPLLILGEGPAASHPSEIPMVDHLIETETPYRDSFGTQLFSMLIVLAMTLVGMMVLAWLLKRVLQYRMQETNVTHSIKILEHRALSHKSILYVVEVEGKRLIVGESLNGLTLLGKLPDSEGSSFEQLLDKPAQK